MFGTDLETVVFGSLHQEGVCAPRVAALCDEREGRVVAQSVMVVVVLTVPRGAVREEV